MNWRHPVLVDPAICHAKSGSKGTRVLVAVVLNVIEVWDLTKNLNRRTLVDQPRIPLSRFNHRSPRAKREQTVC
jgi:hypothetical protein